MKNLLKLLGIAAIVAVIGFSMVACEMDNGFDLLDGVWDRGDIVVTFNNGNGVFTEIKSNSGWIPVLNNGYISIGDQKFRNLKKTGDLKWTGQERGYDPSTYVPSWEDTTITLSNGGQTLQVYTPNVTNPYTTYTKR